MKISFTKRILIIGSIFCGLIYPSQAMDKSEISPRSKYFASWAYGFSKCTIKKRKIKMSKDELIKSVKSQLQKGNDANPNLLKDNRVIEVGEKIAKLMGKDCNKTENWEFREAQYKLFRKDSSSVEKYEKIFGKKFTSEEKSFYQRLKTSCEWDAYLGVDLDKCVTTGGNLRQSSNFKDSITDREFTNSFSSCYKNEENNLKECIRTDIDARKYCSDLTTGIMVDNNKMNKWIKCQMDYKSKISLRRINDAKKQRFDEINRNEDLVLFDKKFCWEKDDCWEPYYDNNSFKVTTDGVTFFEKRNLYLTKEFHPDYSEKSLIGIDCATKEFVQKRGRKNILFPKDATREQKKVFAVKRSKKEYDLACKGGKYPMINKTSQEMFITQKENIFSEETNQKLFESTKEGMQKIDKNSKKQKQKSDNDSHKICLKASDYKGCMNYQNR